MKFVFWIGGIAFVLTAIPCVFFFVVYIMTGENVPKQRAVKFYRWAALAVLSTFNIWIFGRVFGAIRDIWFSSPPPPPLN